MKEYPAVSTANGKPETKARRYATCCRHPDPIKGSTMPYEEEMGLCLACGHRYECKTNTCFIFLGYNNGKGFIKRVQLMPMGPGWQ